MKKINFAAVILLASFLTTGLIGAEKTILNIDFTKNLEPSKSRSAFTGILPKSFRPDFGWNSSKASSKLMTKDGQKFLRIKVSKFDKSVQFLNPIKNLEPGNYKLTVMCRLSGNNMGLGIRQGPAPYRHFWKGSILDTKNTWTKKSFVIRLDSVPDTSIGFYIYPLKKGNYDLISVKLVKVEAKDLVNMTPRPAESCRNFFRNSRLPMGLQAGWNIGRSFNEVTVAGDPSQPGPSGFPSLKLQAKKKIILYSEPFQTSDPLKENFVAFAVKGSGKWRMEVLYSNLGKVHILADKCFEGTSDWKRQTLTFKPDESAVGAKAFTLKISGFGSINLDSFYAGTSLQPYQSQGECEVALGFPESEYSDTRIQFSDEPAKITYCITGDFSGAVLKIKTSNAYGKEVDLPDMNLSAEANEKSVSGVIDVNVFPKTPLGQFRIEAKVERNNKVISPVNELLLTRIRRPVYERKDAPDSPFGTHVASPLTIKMVKSAGVNWARFHDAATELTAWYHLENKKGEWTFYDREIKLYRDSKIKIFAGLSTAPQWASFYQDSGKKKFHGYFDRYFEPKDMNAWSNYVRTVTKRYKGVIDEYFIWNEPWAPDFWHVDYNSEDGKYLTSANPATDFAKLSVAAFKAAKEGNPDAKIAGFNTRAGEKGIKWTKDVFDAGAYPFCDTVDYHIYTGNDQAAPGDQSQQSYNDVVSYLKEKVSEFNKPVYLSEGQGNSDMGLSSRDFGLYKNALTWENDFDPMISADRTCRFIISSLAAGCSKVFLYSAHSFTCLGAKSLYNSIIGPDGYPNVETAAYSNMAWHLEDTKFVRTVKLNDEVNAYIFQGANKTVVAISGLRKAKYQITMNSEMTVRDIFGNPSDGYYQGTVLYITSSLSPEKLECVLSNK